MDAEFVDLRMRRATLLVIFEFLARSRVAWSKTGKAPDDFSDSSFVLGEPDSGERVALWRLEGEIEKALPDVFAPEYKDLVAQEKKRLSEELYGSGRHPS